MATFRRLFFAASVALMASTTSAQEQMNLTPEQQARAQAAMERAKSFRDTVQKSITPEQKAMAADALARGQKRVQDFKDSGELEARAQQVTKKVGAASTTTTEPNPAASMMSLMSKSVRQLALFENEYEYEEESKLDKRMRGYNRKYSSRMNIVQNRVEAAKESAADNGWIDGRRLSEESKDTKRASMAKIVVENKRNLQLIDPERSQDRLDEINNDWIGDPSTKSTIAGKTVARTVNTAQRVAARGAATTVRVVNWAGRRIENGLENRADNLDLRDSYEW